MRKWTIAPGGLPNLKPYRSLNQSKSGFREKRPRSQWSTGISGQFKNRYQRCDRHHFPLEKPPWLVENHGFTIESTPPCVRSRSPNRVHKRWLSGAGAPGIRTHPNVDLRRLCRILGQMHQQHCTRTRIKHHPSGYGNARRAPSPRAAHGARPVRWDRSSLRLHQ